MDKTMTHTREGQPDIKVVGKTLQPGGKIWYDVEATFPDQKRFTKGALSVWKAVQRVQKEYHRSCLAPTREGPASCHKEAGAFFDVVKRDVA